MAVESKWPIFAKSTHVDRSTSWRICLLLHMILLLTPSRMRLRFGLCRMGIVDDLFLGRELTIEDLRMESCDVVADDLAIDGRDLSARDHNRLEI
jgi:hypothetical protein